MEETPVKNAAKCIFCETILQHNSCGQYRCPNCNGVWWPGQPNNEAALLWSITPDKWVISCPVCQSFYTYNKVHGCFECSNPRCRSAFFPPEPPSAEPEVDDNPEWDDSKSLWENEQQYKRRISKTGSGSKSGKKKRGSANTKKLSSERYQLE